MLPPETVKVADWPDVIDDGLAVRPVQVATAGGAALTVTVTFGQLTEAPAELRTNAEYEKEPAAVGVTVPDHGAAVSLTPLIAADAMLLPEAVSVIVCPSVAGDGLATKLVHVAAGRDFIQTHGMSLEGEL